MKLEYKGGRKGKGNMPFAYNSKIKIDNKDVSQYIDHFYLEVPIKGPVRWSIEFKYESRVHLIKQKLKWLARLKASQIRREVTGLLYAFSDKLEDLLSKELVHKTEKVSLHGQEISIDKPLVRLIQEMNRVGLITSACCEDMDGTGFASVAFPKKLVRIQRSPDSCILAWKLKEVKRNE